MRNWNRFFLVLALGTLAVATTSFGEGFNNFNSPYVNHGGFVPNQNQFQRPNSPAYYGNPGGGGTIANGGGGMGGFNTGFNPYQNQNQFQSMYGQQQNFLFNPYTQPYMNSAPWGQYGYNSNQFTNPWTTNWNYGMGNTMMNPYFGSQFQSPYGGGYDQSWMYGNGIPGLGYNVGGLGSNGFYDWGLNGYGNNGFSPYLGSGGFNYDNYGMGLGYGGLASPYDYGGGFGSGFYGMNQGPDYFGGNFGGGFGGMDYGYAGF